MLKQIDTLRYGFGHEINKTQKQTEFRGETIDGPPLNISSAYLPNQPFYWNLTKEHDNSSISRAENPFNDSNKLTFILGNTLYNYTELRDSGYCQPLRKQVGSNGLVLALSLTEPGLYSRVSMGVLFPSIVHRHHFYFPLEY